MRRCYLGSLNKVKLAASKEILKDYEVIGMSVESGVGKQPLSDKATIAGAFNRAQALPKDGLRLGLEAGVQMHGDILFLVNWGVLFDEDDIPYYAGGTRIPLPDFIKQSLFEEKKELAEIMDRYLCTNDIKQKEGAIGYFTASMVKRKEIFTHIVKLLYGQYIKRREYERSDFTR
ncbi:MAG: DUF84 family protein [Bacilli bacterium]|nr:DUF84 family protein [Bacilli bacterium]MDD4076890.1 DUF84 family protein [Bacilli bacterium]MDD4387872.1 DUF84 family protein [Bacilli bacterium]